MEKKCDNCGDLLDNDFSNYCNKCREDYHKKTASNFETRPYNQKDHELIGGNGNDKQ
jgi:hypothetical protein